MFKTSKNQTDGEYSTELWYVCSEGISYIAEQSFTLTDITGSLILKYGFKY